MNRQYKLKFNHATLSLDAVAEIANNSVACKSAKSFKATTIEFTVNSQSLSLNKFSNYFKSVAVAMATLAASSACLANAEVVRSEMQVVAGAASTVTSGILTQITTQGNTIINWQKFGINSNEIVKFVQQNQNNSVLNRVLGGEVTKILGQLQSNGKVFVVNPAGIVFGQGAVVDTAVLVASTLDIKDEDFLQGKYVFNQEKNRALASVINQGMLKVNNDGSLALIGGNIVNRGTLEARNGTVYLLAGKSITIQDLDNHLVSYKVTAANKAINLGAIVAKKNLLLANKVSHGYTNQAVFSDLLGSADSASHATISSTGEITLIGAGVSEQTLTTISTNAEVKKALATNSLSARGLVVVNAKVNADNTHDRGGRVKVLADQVKIEQDAVLSATGKTGGIIYIGGDERGAGKLQLATQTQVAESAIFNVSAYEQAGNITLWGNQVAIAGKYLAQSVKGNGGFVETSGKTFTFAESTRVNTLSQYGTTGTFLLDPDYIVINKDGAGSTTGTDFLSESTVKAQLASTNFEQIANKGINVTGITIQDVSGNFSLTVTGTPEESKDAIRIENSSISTTGKISLVAEGHNITNFNSSLIAGSLLVQGRSFVIESSDQDIEKAKAANNVPSQQNPPKTTRIEIVNPKDDITGEFKIEVERLKMNNAEFRTKANVDIILPGTTHYEITNYSCITSEAGGAIKLNVSCFTSTTDPNKVDLLRMLTLKGGDLEFTSKLDDRETLNLKDFRIIGGPDGHSTVTVNVNKVIFSGSTQIRNNNASGGAVNVLVGGGTQFKGSTITIDQQSLNNDLNIIVQDNNGDSFVDLTGTISSKKALNIDGGNLKLDSVYASGDQGINISATKSVQITGYGDYTADDYDEGVICITAPTITVSDSNKLAGAKGVNLGDVNTKTIDFSSSSKPIYSTEGNVSISATESLNLGDEAKVYAKGYLKLYLPFKDLNADDYQLKSETDIDDYIVNDDAYGTNPNYAFAKGLEVTGRNISVTNSDFSTAESISLTATTKLDLKGSANLNPTQNLYLGGGEITTAQTVTLGAGNNLSINAQAADLDVTKEIAANNISITTSQDFTLKANTKLKAREENLVICATGNLKTESGASLIAEKGSIDLQSQDIELDSTTVSANKDLIIGNQGSSKNLTLKGTTVLKTNSGSIYLTAPEKFVQESAASVNAKQDLYMYIPSTDIDVDNLPQQYGRDLNITAKSITAQSKDFSNSNGNVSLTATTSLTLGGTASLTPSKNLHLGGGEINVESTAKIGAGESLTLTATNATIASSSEISAKSVNMTASNNLIFTGSAQVKATGNDLTLCSSNTLKLADGTTLNADNGEIKLQAQSLSSKDLTATAATGISVETKKTDGVTSEEKLSLINSKLKTTSGEAKLSSSGEIIFKDSNLTSEVGSSTITTNKNVTLDNSNLSGTSVTVKGAVFSATSGSLQATGGAGNVTLSARDSVTLTKTKLESVKASVEVFAPNVVTIRGATIDAEQDVNISSSSNKVSLIQSLVEAKEGEIKVKAGTEVDVTASNLTVKTKAVQLTGESGITASLANISGTTGVTLTTITGTLKATTANFTSSQGNIFINSQGGALDLSNSNVTTQAADKVITLNAKNELNLTNANLSGYAGVNATTLEGKLQAQKAKVVTTVGSITLTSSKGLLNAVESKFNAQGEGSTLTLTSKEDLALNKAEIQALGVVSLSSTNSSISASQAKVTTTNGDLKVIADKGSVDLHESNLTASGEGKDVTLRTKDDLNISHANITGHSGITIQSLEKNLSANNANLTTVAGDISLTTDKGKITAIGANITAVGAGKNVTLNAKDDVVLTSSNVSGQNAVSIITSEGKLELSKANVSAAAGVVTLQATMGRVDAVASNITSQSQVQVKAQTGINLNQANVSGQSEITLNTATGILNVAKANLTSATSAVNLQAVNGNIDAKASNISANSQVKVNADSGIDLTGANITGVTGLQAVTSTGGITAKQAQLNANSGELNLTANSGDITTTGSSLNAVKDSAIINAKQGKADVSGSNITANTSLEITGTVAVNVKNANISGKQAVTIGSTSGTITTSGALVESQDGSIKFTAKAALIDIANSNLTAGQTVSVTAGKGLLANKANISGLQGLTLITEDNDLTAQGANVTATNGNLVVTAKNGKVDLSRSNVTAGNPGSVTLQAATGLSLNMANISGQTGLSVKTTTGDLQVQNSLLETKTGKLELETTDGSATITGSNITAINDLVDLNAAVFEISSSNISGYQGISATAKNGTLKVQNSNLSSYKGDISLTSSAEKVQLTNSNLTAKSGKINLESASLELQNSNLSSSLLNAQTKSGDLSLTNGQLTTTSGDLTLKSAEGYNVFTDKVTVDSKGKLTVAGDNLVMKQDKFVAQDEIILNARKGKAEFTGTDVTTTQGKAVSVTANGGDLVVTNSNITGYPLSLAGDQVTVNSTNLTGLTGLLINANNGSLVTANSKLDASQGTFALQASKEVTLNNGTQVLGQNDSVVEAKGENISATGTNITIAKGNLTLSAAQNTNLNNSNLTALNINVIATENITLEKSKLRSTTNTTLTSKADQVILSSSIVDAKAVIVDGTKYPVISGNDRDTTIPQKVLIVTNLVPENKESTVPTVLPLTQVVNQEKLDEMLEPTELTQSPLKVEAARDDNKNSSTSSIELEQVTAQQFQLCVVSPRSFYAKYKVSDIDQEKLAAKEIVNKYGFTEADAKEFMSCSLHQD